MPENTSEGQPIEVPWGVLGAGLLLVGACWLVSAWGVGAVVLLVVLAVPVGSAVVGGWWYRRWFPHRATRELNKVLPRVGVQGRARLVRRKCKRDGARWEVAWKVPTGVSLAMMARLTGVFEVALDCTCEFWFSHGLIRMRAGTAQLPERLMFEELWRHRPSVGELVFAVGAGRSGMVWKDLAEMPHMLVGGTPGSGKSVFLRQVLVWLTLAYGASVLRVVLIDLKGGMEFWPFRELPHLWRPVVSDMPELGPVLGDVLEELERRQTMFREEGVVSLRHWNERRPADRLPYIVVFIDEFGELSRPAAESSNDQGRARSPKAQAHAAISRIARLGRALGIHLIACTQRPDADVMPGQIKDQLPATVAFRTRSETNSHILLGDKDPAAALLPPIKGRAIFQWEEEDEVQAPFIEPEAAVALLRARYDVVTVVDEREAA
jgi:hypothetical protein